MNWVSIIILVLVAVSAGNTADVEVNDAALTPPAIVATSVTSVWRRVLSMSEDEREAFIAKKPAGAQPYLRQKVQEYLSLPDGERETRLRALEVRALMLAMMHLPQELRAIELKKLPADLRKEISQRLIVWDPLPPSLQKDVLENETVARLLVESQTSGLSRSNLVAKLPPQGREQMEKDLERWDNLPQDQQQQILDNAKSFFDQDEKARSRTLGVLAESDRVRLNPTLAALDRMSRQQRDMALEGFRKFKQLSREDQQQFLLTAQRWEAMTDKEKRIWRQVVASVPRQPLPYPPAYPVRAPARQTSN